MVELCFDIPPIAAGIFIALYCIILSIKDMQKKLNKINIRYVRDQGRIAIAKLTLSIFFYPLECIIDRSEYIRSECCGGFRIIFPHSGKSISNILGHNQGDFAVF